MNGMGNCGEDSAECPLCMEPFEVDDLNFYPCTCGYQVRANEIEMLSEWNIIVIKLCCFFVG